MAPAPTDQTFRITALCIRRLCFGYRNKTLMPSPVTRPDVFSAAIVIATAFVVVCLMLMLLLVFLESIRIITISYVPPGVEKSAENIAHIYNKLIESCPPTWPSKEGTCSICLEDYSTTAIGRNMPCNHFFHIACIDRWILRSASERSPRDVARCPVCKQPVLKEHVEIPVQQTLVCPENERRYSEEMHLAENMA